MLDTTEMSGHSDYPPGSEQYEEAQVGGWVGGWVGGLGCGLLLQPGVLLVSGRVVGKRGAEAGLELHCQH